MLLKTKLHRPTTRPGTLPRPRLSARLLESGDCKLTLVSAPAGFGKTTLLAGWMPTSEQAPAWLSLDAGDNDAVRFLTYLIAALQEVNPSWGQTAQSRFLSPQPPSPFTVASELINELSGVDTPCYLVLDDYHVITDPSVHEVVGVLLERAPAKLRLVILTRADPPLPLARLRARGEMLELRAQELRFSRQEATRLLQKSMALTLTPDQIAALDARIEGWPAGLHLVGLALRDRSDMASFLTAFTGSHRYVFDYLSEEVLDQQNEDVQAFLLHTSMLERLSGPLCDAVTARTDSQFMLEDLNRRNLFLIALDEENGWYRYHHLFADLLRRRFMSLHPEHAGQLLSLASRWCAENDLLEEAITYALAGKEYERTGALIEEAAAVLMRQQGRYRGVERWIAALPDTVVRRRGGLCLLRAWILFLTGQRESATDWAEEAEHSLNERGVEMYGEDTAALYRATATTMQGALAFSTGDLTAARAWALRAQGTVGEQHLEAQAYIKGIQGTIDLVEGQLERARATLQDAARLAMQAHNTLAGVIYTAYHARACIGLGELRYGHAAALRGLDTLRQQQHDSAALLGGYLHDPLAAVCYEWNDLEDAATYLEQGLAHGKQLNDTAMMLLNSYLLVWLLHRSGRRDEAYALLDEALDTTRGGKAALYWDMAWEALQVRLWLNEGHFASAGAWAESYEQPPVNQALARFRCDQALARVRIAQRRPDEALHILNPAVNYVEEIKARHWTIQLKTLQAMALQLGGESEKAQHVLVRTLSLAEPEGYIRTFVDLGAPMADLLTALLTKSKDAVPVPTGYIGNLLTTIRDEQRPGAHALQEPLSEREMEVLRLLAAGLPNRSIAEQLFLAIGTVKKHTHTIYRKLDVENRAQAIDVSQRMGLL